MWVINRFHGVILSYNCAVCYSASLRSHCPAIVCVKLSMHLTDFIHVTRLVSHTDMYLFKVQISTKCETIYADFALAGGKWLSEMNWLRLGCSLCSSFYHLLSFKIRTARFVSDLNCLFQPYQPQTLVNPNLFDHTLVFHELKLNEFHIFTMSHYYQKTM